ncbi:unnamed protein product [Choristocarpus tenellus]
MVHIGDQRGTPNALPTQVDEKSALQPLHSLRTHESSMVVPKSVVVYRYSLCIAYMLCSGVCGLVLVILGASVADVWKNIGYVSSVANTELGSAFITRGVGAVIGNLFAAKFYRWMPGNAVLAMSVLGQSSFLFYLPFINSLLAMHMSFFVDGFSSGVTTVGIQFMTRKAVGQRAGPWLAANTVMFCMIGTLAPPLSILTDSFVARQSVFAGFAAAVGVFLLVLPPPEKHAGLLEASLFYRRHIGLSYPRPASILLSLGLHLILLHQR